MTKAKRISVLLVNAIILVVVFFQARSCIGAGTIINKNTSLPLKYNL